MPNLSVNKITFQPVSFQENRHVSQPQFQKAPDIKPDTVEIKEKKEKEEKRAKALKIFVLGWIIKAAVTFVGLKLYRNNYVNRAQKTFQEVFMRDNITKEETIEMLKRYKEIKKIKDKDQYVQKLFEEVKKNFGFKDKPIKLIIKDLPDTKASGGCSIINDYIETDLKKGDKGSLIGHIHHEFRHAKQHELMFNEFPEHARRKALDRLLKPKEGYTNRAEDIVTKKISYEEAFEHPEIAKFYYESLGRSGGIDVAEKKTLQRFKNKIDQLIKENFGELSPQNVPEKYKDFALKCRENNANYINIDKDYDAYLKQFVEKDAYDVQSKIAKLLRGFIPV